MRYVAKHAEVQANERGNFIDIPDGAICIRTSDPGRHTDSAGRYGIRIFVTWLEPVVVPQ